MKILKISEKLNLKRLPKTATLSHQMDSASTSATAPTPEGDSSARYQPSLGYPSPGSIIETLSSHLPPGNDHGNRPASSARSMSLQENTAEIPFPEQTVAIRAPSAQLLSSPSLFKSPWEKAVEKLQKVYPDEFDLDDTDPRQIATDVLEAVKAKWKECERKLWKYQKGNGKVVVLREVVYKISKNLDKFALVHAAASQAGSQTAFVWTTFRAILQVASNDTEIMQRLLREMEHISSILGRCATYEDIFKDSQLETAQRLMDCLPDLYADILTYLLSSKRYFSQNTAKRYIKSTVNPYAEKFGPLVEEIRKQEEKVEKAARATSDEFLVREVVELEKTNFDVERSELATWLSEVPFEKHHSLICNSRQPNTGNWLLEKEDFIDWKNYSKSSLLWLHGIAGSGKTFLASLAIDVFATRRSTDHAVAYFYCKDGERERQNSASILRTIMKQLFMISPEHSLPESVISAYRKHKRGGFEFGRLPISECQELIVDLAAEFKQTVIIIDALDECDKDSRKQLLDALDQILESSAGVIKIFVTSRDADDIELKLEGVPNIYIQASDNSGDIAAFAIAQIEKSISGGTLLGGSVDPNLQKVIIEKLTDAANGMFLWVSLQIKSICEKRTLEGIESALNRLPQSLKATYSAIWDKICDQCEENRGLAMRTLKWIVCSKKPLTLDAIVKAVSIEPTDGTAKQKHEGLTATDLVHVCHNLIVKDEQLGVLRTAHFSVNEFLQDIFQMPEAHTLAAEVCLTLMCDPNFYNPVHSIYHHPLRAYVTENWVHHTRSSGDGANLLALQKKFLTPSLAYYAWLRETQKRVPWLTTALDSAAQLTPLWISCYYQLWNFCKDLLSDDVDCNVRNLDGVMPLHLAAMHGNDVVVKLLIENQSVDLYSKDNYNRSALWHASSKGQEAVVKLLLEKEGEELNSKACDNIPYHYYLWMTFSDDNFYLHPKVKGRHTALSIAALRGHDRVVKLLLRTKGVHFNSKDNNGNTPLLAAASEGKDAVITQLLATKGIDSSCKDNFGRTLLWYTAQSGNETAVKLSLATEGVDLNAADNEGVTPLLAAASAGRCEAIKLLLATEGVDSSCKDNFGRTLLWYTAQSGNETAVKLSLATEGVDLNAADNKGLTPLLAAASAGRCEVIKLLLATEGVDSSCKDNSGRALLWHTVRSGNETAVKLSLATESVDLNAMDSEGMTPLLAAMSGLVVNNTVAKLLLAKDGINLNAKDKYGTTPLLAVAARGIDAMVTLLLATEGVDSSCKDNSGRTPLWYTARSGNETAVKLLLAKGEIDLNSTDDGGMTPLLAAASEGKDAVVALLFATEGVDWSCKDNYGRTLLWYTARSGNETAVKLLLAKEGVNLDAADNGGMTPLLVATSEGRDAVVKLLLAEDRIVLNAKNNDGKTPLLVAVSGWRVNYAVIELLLTKEGIDLNAMDDEGMTPLLAAASRGRDAIVALLLATKGVDSSCKDYSGRTVLWYMARSGNKTAIKRLLANKSVDLNIADNEGITPLLAAASAGKYDVMKLLLATEGVDSSCKDNSGRTLLWYTARNGNETAVKLSLATEGVDLNAADNEGITPLLAAASAKRYEVIKLLLATEGVDSSCKDNSGRTLFWYTAQSGNETAVKLLLAKGNVDFNATDNEGITPLLAAASAGRYEVIKLLHATEGVDSSCKDNFGRTLLWYAARSGNETAVKLSLTMEGVDLNAVDNEGITPLLAAASAGRYEVIELLLATEGVDSSRRDNSGRTLLWYTARSGNETTIKLLLAKEGVDLNAADNDGITPLLAAASEGRYAMVKLLLANKDAKSNHRDNSGRTLFWYTARSGNKTAVKLLLATEGVDLNAADNEGMTPLLAAASAGRYAVIKLLLATEGVDLSCKDNSGRTLFWYAARSGNEAAVKLLLAKDGIDLNAADNEGMTPLLTAASAGRYKVIKLLRTTKGVDSSCKDNSSSGILHEVGTQQLSNSCLQRTVSI